MKASATRGMQRVRQDARIEEAQIGRRTRAPVEGTEENPRDLSWGQDA
jgi:hypothetical protein